MSRGILFVVIINLYLTVMTKKFKNSIAAVGVASLLLPFMTMAADVEVTSAYVGIDPNNVVEVIGDHAPGFPEGSIASDGSGKSAFYFEPTQLFGREVTLGEIESISYWTKKDTDHVTEPGDWYLQIYTKPYDGDISPASWYGERITAEPYFSVNLDAPVDTWNQWTTDDATNTLRFFDSALGYFGGYADPTWDTYVAGNALSGQPLATREILYVTIQTGSGWADGFEGQVDGLVIELTDDSNGTVNFEAEIPFEASLEITSPEVDATVSGLVEFAGVYTDEDGNDAVQWAVRAGTCAAGTGAVYGNVDGKNTPFSWDGENFYAEIDMSADAPGSYCFVLNPKEDAGDANLRATREFTLEASAPTEKNQCKKGGWEEFGFKNQGQCVRFFETGKDSR